MARSRVSMCCHCGRMRVADDSPTFPAHFERVIPGQEFGSLCAGSFDVSRDPTHDRRKLTNGQEPPSLEDMGRFLSKNTRSK